MLEEGIEDDIVQWMQEQLEEREARGVLVGLSGGVDSSVVAALIKKAFGDRSLGVLLPCSGTISKDVKYAEMVADRFDLETISVNLEDAFNSIKETFEKIDVDRVKREYWPQTKIPTVEPDHQNIITRLRMMTLYNIAEKMNFVVMGTSNKSEIYTGYYTLYGDGATDMRPLGDLYKTEVWELAERLNVPEEIIERPPTGGLMGKQTNGDEEEFGIDYQTMDQIHLELKNGRNVDRFDNDDVTRTKELVSAADSKEDIPVFKKE